MNLNRHSIGWMVLTTLILVSTINAAAAGPQQWNCRVQRDQHVVHGQYCATVKSEATKMAVEELCCTPKGCEFACEASVRCETPRPPRSCQE